MLPSDKIEDRMCGMKEITLKLLEKIISEHPLPWRIERDWMWEVVASDNSCVAGFGDITDAQDLMNLVDLWEKRKAESVNNTMLSEDAVLVLPE